MKTQSKSFPISRKEFLAWLALRGGRRVGTKCHCPVERAIKALTGEDFSIINCLQRDEVVPAWVTEAVILIDDSLENLLDGWSQLTGSQALAAVEGR